MQSFLYLSIILVLAVGAVCLQNYYCKNLFHNISDNLLFSIIVYVIAVLIMVVMNAMNNVKTISAYTLMLALIYGILLTVDMICALEAMRRGSMALTQMFVMSSLVVPIIAAMIIWKETVTWIQMAGIMMMLAAMALILITVKSKDGRKVSFTWLILVIVAFLGTGTEAIVQKVLTYSPYIRESSGFLLYGYLTAMILTTGILIIRIAVNKEQTTIKLASKQILPIILIGAAGGVIGYLFLKAMKVTSTSVLYPINNGGRLILVTVMDVIIFKQKLSDCQYAGLALGSAAIALLSIQ